MTDDPSRPTGPDDEDPERERDPDTDADPDPDADPDVDAEVDADEDPDDRHPGPDEAAGRTPREGDADAETAERRAPERETEIARDAELESEAEGEPGRDTEAERETGTDPDRDSPWATSGDRSTAEGDAVPTDADASPDDVDSTPEAADGPEAAGESSADGARGPDDHDGSSTARGDPPSGAEDGGPPDSVPEDVRKYERFKKMDGAQYERVNEFLRDRTYVTAREWAIARLCADFRTETGVEMTKIGENLPELVPFMTDTYSPQAVNQARASFEEKVRQSGATFLYGAMSGFFTAEQLDDVMYEVTEVAKFLLEVEGVDLTVDEELEAEDRISAVMREVRSASEQLRHDELSCPNCGHEMMAADAPEAPSEE